MHTYTITTLYTYTDHRRRVRSGGASPSVDLDPAPHQGDRTVHTADQAHTQVS